MEMMIWWFNIWLVNKMGNVHCLCGGFEKEKKKKKEEEELSDKKFALNKKFSSTVTPEIKVVSVEILIG